MYSPEGSDFSLLFFFLPSACKIAGNHLVGHMLSLGSSQFTLEDNCQPVFSSKQFSPLSVHFKKQWRRVDHGELPDTHLSAITSPPQWDGRENEMEKLKGQDRDGEITSQL